MHYNLFNTQEKIDKHSTHCKNISDSMSNYFSFIRECADEQLQQQIVLLDKAKSIEEITEIVINIHYINDVMVKAVNQIEIYHILQQKDAIKKWETQLNEFDKEIKILMEKQGAEKINLSYHKNKRT